MRPFDDDEDVPKPRRTRADSSARTEARGCFARDGQSFADRRSPGSAPRPVSSRVASSAGFPSSVCDSRARLGSSPRTCKRNRRRFRRYRRYHQPFLATVGVFFLRKSLLSTSTLLLPWSLPPPRPHHVSFFRARRRARSTKATDTACRRRRRRFPPRSAEASTTPGLGNLPRITPARRRVQLSIRRSFGPMPCLRIPQILSNTDKA